MIKSIHVEIEKKLDSFLLSKKVPNILFHGASGSGKRSIVNNFINKIYSFFLMLSNVYILTNNLR